MEIDLRNFNECCIKSVDLDHADLWGKYRNCNKNFSHISRQLQNSNMPQYEQNTIMRLLTLVENMQSNVEDLVQENMALAKDNLRLTKLAEKHGKDASDSNHLLESAKAYIEVLEAKVEKAENGDPLNLPLEGGELDNMLSDLEMVYDNMQDVKHEFREHFRGNMWDEVCVSLDNLESIHKRLRFLKQVRAVVGDVIEYKDPVGCSKNGVIKEVIPPRLRLQTRDGPKTLSVASVMTTPSTR